MDDQELDRDIEKQLADSPKAKSSRLKLISLLIFCTILFCGVIIVLSNPKNSSNLMEKFQSDQDNFLSRVLDADITSTSPMGGDWSPSYDGPDVEVERSRGLFEKILDFWKGNQHKYDDKDAIMIDLKGIDLELLNLKNPERVTAKRPSDPKVASSAKTKVLEDDNDLINHYKRPQAEKANPKQAVGGSGSISAVSMGAGSTSGKIHSPNTQSALKEILLVSAMTILLSNDPQSSSPNSKEKEKQVVNIIKSLSITPQPTMVNLIKHPKYDEIVEYLKTYQYHKIDDSTESDSEDIVEVTVENIPSVFIGGLPVGNYDDIIEMYDKKKLVTYLRLVGKGIISVE